MVTTDRDFEISHLLPGVPRDLLLVTTGDISNEALLELVSNNRVSLVTLNFPGDHSSSDEPETNHSSVSSCLPVRCGADQVIERTTSRYGPSVPSTR